MSRRLASVFTLLAAQIFSVGASAQILTRQQTDAVRAAVAETGGELGKLQAFVAPAGLPTDLDRGQTEALLDELMKAYREGIVTANGDPYRTLGELPPTLAALREQGEGERRGPTPRTMPLGAFRMPFQLVRREGSGVPDAGRPLFICTHGGGGNRRVDGPHAWDVNSREWRIQTRFATRLYAPEGLYFVPRMADDRKGRWRHAHHHDQFELAIRHGILFWGVDPNRVYKLGISQGGFGTAILGAFMPDLFAGINPMAGGGSLGLPVENVRNLACYSSIGEKDTTFNRVGHVRDWHRRLDELAKSDPGGYRHHHLDLQAGRGHGIDYRPGAPWIARFTRTPHPDVVVWTSEKLDGRRRPSMYWVELRGAGLEGRVELEARIDRGANRVAVTANRIVPREDARDDGEKTRRVALADSRVSILLRDELLDLGRQVSVTLNGETVFEGPVVRDGATLLETLVRRGDPNLAFPVRIRLEAK